VAEFLINKELAKGFECDRSPELVTSEGSSAAKTADLLKVSPIRSEDLMHCSFIELACGNGVVDSILRRQSTSVELRKKKNKGSENI
jgi:hypothetical protein